MSFRLPKRLLSASLSLVVAVQPAAAETVYYYRQTNSAPGGKGAGDPVTGAEKGALNLFAPAEVRARPGIPFAMSLEATNAKGGVRWSLAKGSFPDGLALTSDGRVVGTPASAGRAEGIVVAAEDAEGNAGMTSPFVIDVRPLPIIAMSSPPALKAGQALTVQPSVTEAYGSRVWALASGALPLGTGVDPGTGLISGTPEQKGTFENVVLSVTDVDGATGHSAPISVTVDSNLTVAGLQPGYTVRAGKAMRPIRPYALGVEGAATWSFPASAGSVPSWLALDAWTGTLTGTPVASGATDLALKVLDSGSGSSLASPSFKVTAVGTPSLAMNELYSFRSGASQQAPRPVTLSAKATGLIGGGHYFVQGALPGGLEMTEAGQVAGNLYGVGERTTGLQVKVIDGFDGATSLSNPFTVEILKAVAVAAPGPMVFEKGWFSSFAPPRVQNAVGDVTWRLMGPALPEGLAFDGKTGAVSGTASRSGPPLVGFNYLVTDSYDNAVAYSDVFTLTVSDETPFAVLPVDAGTLRVGSLATVTPDVRGRRGDLTWAVGGALPEWATFDAGTGGISGVPPAAGTYGPYTLTATDSVLAKGVSSSPFTLSVIPANDVSIAAVAKPAQQGAPYDLVPTVKDAVGPYAVSLRQGTLPEGLSLDPGTGRISGVPKAAGTYGGLRLSVTDARGAAVSGTFSIQVAPGFGPDGQPYSASMPAMVDGTTYALIDQTPTFSGFTGDLTWSVQGNVLPYWLTLDPATGRISGKPASTGTWPDFVLKVMDANGLGAVTNAFTVAVTESVALRIEVADRVPFNVGVAGAANPVARNATGATSWTYKGTLPDGLGVNPATGRITGAPTTAGSYPDIVLTVRDATGATASSDPFTILVTRGNIVAVVPATSYFAPYGKAFATPAPRASGAVGATRWSMAPGSSLPAWASINPSTGVISGKPSTPDALGITAGLSLLVATDTQEGVGNSTFSIAVPRPILAASPYSTRVSARVGSALIAVPTVEGRIGEVSWSLAGTLPAGLTFGPKSGTITGTAEGPGTADGLVLTVTDAYDGKTASTAPFSVAAVERPSRLDVVGPGDLPALRGEALAAPGPTASNAYGTLRWTAKTALPAWLRLDEGTGVLSGTPDTVGDVAGLVLAVADADGVPGETAPFTVRVAPNLKVSGLKASYSFAARKPLAIPAPTVANATGAVTWTIAGGTLPEGLDLDGATGVISGTPPYAGTANGIVLRVTDARGDAGDGAPFNIVVAGMLIGNVTPSYPLVAGAPFEMQAPAVTGNSGMVSWSLESGTLPSWATFDAATGRIKGTPATVGRTSGLRLLATDAGGGTAMSAFFTLAVDAKLAVDRMPTSFEYPVGETFTLAPPAPRDAVGKLAWTLDGTLPSWLKFDADTGRLAGAPTAKGDVGPLTLRVSDTTLKSAVAGVFTVKVLPNIKVANVPSAYPARIGVPFASPAPTVANAAPPVRWSVVDAGSVAAPQAGAAPSPLPTWAGVDPATGVISGTPVAGGGSGSLVLVATDANGDTGRSPAFRIAVSNGLEVTNVAATYRTRVGSPVAVQPGVTGTQAVVAWEVFSGNLPTWAALEATTGRISGTPTGAGSIPLALKVSDAGGLEGYSPAFNLVVGEAMGIGGVEAEVSAKIGVAVNVVPAGINTVGAVAWDLQGELPAWATFDRSTGRISGTPTAAGEADLTLVGTDADHGRATRAFRIKVAKNIVVSGLNGPYQAIGGGALATDVPTARYASGGVRWGLAAGQLPGWATLMEATGVISGSPDSPGSVTVAIRATDAEGTTGDSAPFSITVSSGFAVTGPSDQEARVDVQGATAAPSVASPSAGGAGPSAPIRWTLVGAIPAWAMFDGGTGVLSGKPTKAETFPNLVLRATDAKGLQAYTQPFSLTVTPAMNVTPLEADYAVRAGAKLSIYPVAVDGVGTVTWSVANKPAWLSLNAATGALTGKAPSTAPSPVTLSGIVLTATDSKGFAASGTPFSVTVTPGLAVNGVAATYDGRQGYAFSDIVPVVTGGKGVLAWSATGLPAGMVQDPVTGKVTGVPGTYGSYPAVLTVKDPSDDATGDLRPTFTLARTLAVTGVGPRMVARNGVGFTGALPGLVGQRGGPAWSVVGTLPPWASLSPTTGGITGRPTALSSTPGLKIQVQDGTDKVTATSDAFTLDVLEPVGIAGLPTSIVARFGFDFSAAAPNLLNAVGATTWTWAAGVTPPKWLTLDPSTGVISGVAKDMDQASVGTTTNVRVTATDSTQASANSVSIAVSMYAQAKVTVMAQNIRNRVGDTVTITPQQTGIVGTPSWSIVATSGALPAGLVADPATGKVSAKITGVGTASFVLRVTDSLDQRSFDSDAFSIVTKPAFAISGLANEYRVRVTNYRETAQPMVVGAQAPVRFALNMGATGSTPPTGMAFDVNTGVLSGVPSIQAAYPTVTVTATDPTVGDTRTSTATFALYVLGPVSVSGTTNFSVRSGSDVTQRSFTPMAVNSIDPSKVAWRLAAGTPPSGVTVDPTTGKLAGTAPTVSTSMQFAGLRLTAVDADQSQATSATPFTITVNPVLDFAVADQSAKEGQSFAYALVPAGKIGTLTWAAAGLPAGLSIDPKTGAISGTPSAPGPKANYAVEVSLSDDADGATPTPVKKSFTLAVAAAPVLAGTIANAVLGDQYLPAATGPCSTVTVSNTGSVATTDLAASFAAADAANFKSACSPTTTATVLACTGVLAPGKQCVVGVSLGGTSPGSVSGSLQISATGALPKAVSVSGTIRPAFEPFTFTSCGVSGQYGPSGSQCATSYKNVAAWTQDPAKFSVTNGRQKWTVPVSGTYKFVAAGGSGGTTSSIGGPAAVATVSVALAAGDVVSIVVGQKGGDGQYGNEAGGGGGTFVVSGQKGLLVAAGGGGGGSNGASYASYADGSKTTSGVTPSGGGTGGSAGKGGGAGYSAGGGGFTGDGVAYTGYGGSSYSGGSSGSNGFSNAGVGGFGGGGGGGYSGGGGGGYSGGGGGGSGYGGGGGSYGIAGGNLTFGGTNAYGNGSVAVTMQ